VNLRVILRNILSNWLSYAVASIVGFALTPFVISRLGNTGYGVWTLVLSLTGYFGLLDLGIRSSVGRFVARYMALDDDENVNRTISTALVILGGTGLLSLLATVILYLGFGNSFKVDTNFASSATTALLISGLTISVALPMGVFGAILFSLERFDVTTGINILGVLVKAILIVTFLKMGYGIVVLAVITLLVSLAEYSAIAIMAKVLYEPLKPGVHLVQFSMLKELFGFGVYRFLWIIANQLIFYTDSVVIGFFLGASSITFYAIAGSVINYGRYLVSLAIDPLFPAATRFHSRNDVAGLQRLQILGTQMGLLVGLPVSLGFVYLGNQFITLWIGEGYGLSATILTVLALAQVTSTSQYISALILAGMAKHRILAYVVLVEAVVNVCLSIFLVQKMGVIGVAWGTVIPHVISTGIVIPLYTIRTLHMNAFEYVTAAYARPMFCALPVAALCYAFSMWVTRPTWAIFAGEVAAVCGSFAVLSYFICLTHAQRSAAVAKVRGFFQREAFVNEA
jgi:O-antigen/teichoic acid export membrane protein